ncbi:MAG: toxic anion resistance protein [Selenomonadaceae bacterium]|nr:toxic anion resistance protein [Selenomonadaceae bacterium]
MADISLDKLLQAKSATTADVTPILAPQQEIEKVTRQTELLTPEERKQVDAIKEGFDITDSSQALQFGNAAQKNLADFSDSILAQVRTKDSGYVGELLTDLSTKIDEFSQNETKGFMKKLPIIGKLVNKADGLVSAYDKLSVKVDKIQAELEKSKLAMMKDIIMFDSLYDKNLEYFKSLQLYIQAGEEKLSELRTITLPKLRQEAAVSSDPMAGQVVADFENTVDRFEKKVHDLKLSKTIAIQTAPQLRLIQNNDRMLVERVQSAIYNAIPLWKNQIIIALGLSRQQQLLKTQRAINDTTNELLRKNAEMLKINSIETAKENDRSIVDIETVRKVNEDLITTIEETIQIQRDGRAKRQSAEQELQHLEERLKNTLLANMDYTPRN